MLDTLGFDLVEGTCIQIHDVQLFFLFIFSRHQILLFPYASRRALILNLERTLANHHQERKISWLPQSLSI
jgi:hypothetical protein